ncbi:MAG TPA: THUMP domain-containing protein [Myxococcota bacterium]|nr:THUMP domain-containing protein [Myxococcota bacterium]
MSAGAAAGRGPTTRPPTTWFATCARGIEEVLADELRALGASDLTVERAGCRFSGPVALAWRACLWLRTASRVLRPIADFDASDAEALYAGAREVPWEEHLGTDARHTFAVSCAGRGSPIAHTHFAALKVKDAIADRLRARYGRRPDVDARDPDVAVFLRLHRTRATLHLDLAGESLHRRGYRPPGAEAPLKETLAAACVALSGWDGRAPLLDPMCGTGTLVLEAALRAAGVAPGLRRAEAGRFGFQRWPGYEAAAFAPLLQEARAAVRALGASAGAGHAATAPWPWIEGSDHDARALAQARAGAAAAGPAITVRWTERALDDVAPPPAGEGAGPGVLLTNPPYGARQGDTESLRPLYRRLGDVLKQRFAGWTAFVLTGNVALAKEVGLRPSRRIPLFNGALECRLLRFDLY